MKFHRAFTYSIIYPRVRFKSDTFQTRARFFIRDHFSSTINSKWIFNATRYGTLNNACICCWWLLPSCDIDIFSIEGNLQFRALHRRFVACSIADLINFVILYKKQRREFHSANPLKKQIRLRAAIIACRQMQSLATTDWIAFRGIAIGITSRAILSFSYSLLFESFIGVCSARHFANFTQRTVIPNKKKKFPIPFRFI